MQRSVTTAQLARVIGYTLLRPETTKSDVLRVCEEAKQYGFSVIFVPPCYLDEAARAVEGTGIRVGIPHRVSAGCTPHGREGGRGA